MFTVLKVMKYWYARTHAHDKKCMMSLLYTGRVERKTKSKAHLDETSIRDEHGRAVVGGHEVVVNVEAHIRPQVIACTGSYISHHAVIN